MVGLFYFGSNPADDAAGKYPGKAIAGGGNRFKPAPPEFINLTADFEQLWDRSVGGVDKVSGGLPKLYVDAQKKAWRSTFDISGGFDDSLSDPDPYARAASGDKNQFYGAADIKFNPIEFAQDPVKHLKGIVKDGFNIQDFRKRGRDELIQNLLVNPNGVAGGATLSNRMLNATLDSYNQRNAASFERAGGSITSGAGLVSLNLLDPSHEIIFGKSKADTPESKRSGNASDKRYVVKDSRAEFGVSAVKYFRVEDSSKRNVGFKGLVNQAGNSMNDIFAMPAVSGGGNRRDELINAVAVAQGGSVAANVSRLQNAHERFYTMNDVTSQLGAVSSSNSKAAGALAGVERARVLPGIPGPIDIGNVAKAAEIGYATAEVRTFGANVKALHTKVAAMETAYASSPYATAAQKKQVKNWVKKMNAEIEALAGGGSITTMDSDFASIVSTSDASKRKALANRINTFNRNVGTPDIFREGLHQELSHVFLEHHVLPSKGSPLDSVSTLAGSTTFGRQIQMVSIMARDSVKFNHASDMFATLEGDKVVATLFNSRFLNALPNYTPQKIVRNTLEKNHFFGLKIDSKTLEKYREMKAGGAKMSPLAQPGSWFVDSLSKTSLGGALFKNKFSVDLDLGGGKLTRVASLVGGEHLNGITSLVQIRNMNETLLRQMLGGASTGGAIAALHPNALHFIDSIRASYPGMNTKQAFMVALMGTTSHQDFLDKFGYFPFSDADKVYANIENLKNLVRTGQIKLDIFDGAGNFDPNKFGNLDKLLQWFHDRSQNPSYISYTQELAGVMEKLTQKFNILQDRLMRTKIFGFNVGKLFFWEQQLTANLYNRLLTVATKLGNKIISRFTTGLVVGATGGLASFLAPLIEKVVYFVTTKIVATLNKAVSAVFKGDFGAIGRAFEATLKLIAKLFAYVSLGVAIFMLLPGFIIHHIAMNISPKAPYSYNNILPNGFIEFVGEGDVVPGACSNLCITQGGTVYVSEGSYAGRDDIGAGARGHGSNNYWAIVGGIQNPNDVNEVQAKACTFQIPTTGYNEGNGPTEQLDNADSISNFCSPSSRPNFAPYSSDYGKAMDLHRAGGAAGVVVCAPALGNVAYWITGAAATWGEKGAMMDLAGYDSSDNLVYMLRYLHLSPDSVVASGLRAAPGDGIGTIHSWPGDVTNSHVHIELKNSVSGDILAPENAGMCY